MSNNIIKARVIKNVIKSNIIKNTIKVTMWNGNSKGRISTAVTSAVINYVLIKGFN